MSEWETVMYTPECGMTLTMHIWADDNPEGVQRDPVEALKALAHSLEDALPERFRGHRFYIEPKFTHGKCMVSEEEFKVLDQAVKDACAAGGCGEDVVWDNEDNAYKR